MRGQVKHACNFSCIDDKQRKLKDEEFSRRSWTDYSFQQKLKLTR